MDKGFIERLKTARKKMGITQHQLANEIGTLKGRTIQNYEQGVSEPPMSFIKQLAELANVSPAWIAFGDIISEVNPTIFDEGLMRQSFKEIDAALANKGIPSSIIFDATLELYHNKLKEKAEMLTIDDTNETQSTGTYGK